VVGLPVLLEEAVGSVFVVLVAALPFDVVAGEAAGAAGETGNVTLSVIIANLHGRHQR
jgi:hypothetical protein